MFVNIVSTQNDTKLLDMVPKHMFGQFYTIQGFCQLLDQFPKFDGTPLQRLFRNPLVTGLQKVGHFFFQNILGKYPNQLDSFSYAPGQYFCIATNTSRSIMDFSRDDFFMLFRKSSNFEVPQNR